MPVKAQAFFRTGGLQQYLTVLSAAAKPIVLRTAAAAYNAKVASVLSEYEEARAKRKDEFKVTCWISESARQASRPPHHVHAHLQEYNSTTLQAVI